MIHPPTRAITRHSAVTARPLHPVLRTQVGQACVTASQRHVLAGLGLTCDAALQGHARSQRNPLSRIRLGVTQEESEFDSKLIVMKRLSRVLPILTPIPRGNARFCMRAPAQARTRARQSSSVRDVRSAQRRPIHRNATRPRGPNNAPRGRSPNAVKNMRPKSRIVCTQLDRSTLSHSELCTRFALYEEARLPARCAHIPPKLASSNSHISSR